MGALDAIRYVLTESEDSDYWNKFYKDKWGEIYGQKNFDVTNDFAQSLLILFDTLSELIVGFP